MAKQPIGNMLRIKGPGEFDRFDDILRFEAWHRSARIPFSISALALRKIAIDRGDEPAEPSLLFALHGGKIEEIATTLFEKSGCDTGRTYHIDWGDVVERYGRNG